MTELTPLGVIMVTTFTVVGIYIVIAGLTYLWLDKYVSEDFRARLLSLAPDEPGMDESVDVWVESANRNSAIWWPEYWVKTLLGK